MKTLKNNQNHFYLKKMICHWFLLIILAIAPIPMIFFHNSQFVEAAMKEKLSSTQATLCVGDTLTLKVTGSNKKITWSTSDKSIATVTSKGVVKAKKMGIAIISAKVGSNKLSCNVTVNNVFTIEDGVLIKYNGKGGEVVIPDSVTNIGDRAFIGCETLTSVTIPDTVKSIGIAAFVRCKQLKSIVIPDSVTSIGDQAFNFCIKLAEVSIPDSVINIGGKVFTSTPWLETKLKENPFVIVNNILIDCSPCSGDIVIPDSVTYIANRVFNNHIKLTSISIPASVTGIGDFAFSACERLTSITIPASVTGIGASAFSSCYNLKTITIQGSVSNIGKSAFYNCEKLEEITIPDTVTTIENEVFYNCKALTSINIPGSVTSIGADAFYSCKNLTNITIPASVISIGDSAFFACNKLTSITIPSSVTSIGSKVFTECSTKLTISGSEGSQAQTYAEQNSIKYKILIREGSGTSTNTQTEESETGGIKKGLELYEDGKYNAARKQFNKFPETAPEVETMSAAMKKAYLKEVLHYKTFSQAFTNAGEYIWSYYLTDIDKDNVVELLIKHGTCEADSLISVFKYSKGKAVKVSSISGAHCALYAYPDDNGFIKTTGQMGYETISVITLQDNILTTDLIGSRDIGKDDYMNLPYMLAAHNTSDGIDIDYSALK